MFLIAFTLCTTILGIESACEITPYKFTERDVIKGMPAYTIPMQARFTVKRSEINAPNIVYYLSKPKVKKYPIVIICDGSSNEKEIRSVIHIHRYALKELTDLNCAVLTVEQWGVDGNQIDIEEFMAYYTRSQRLRDHQTVITDLKANPPTGWNGKLIFIGASEGGVIVSSLTEKYPADTIATINLCGAYDWPWDEELWAYILNMRKNGPRWLKLWSKLNLPKNKKNYQILMKKILQNRSPNKKFMGMTYMYHADALLYLRPDYAKIRTPFLVVGGTKDPAINSFDDFVRKGNNAGVNITYFRIENMDHYVRKRSDVFEKVFAWLRHVFL